ncbi:unnamed protein product [Thelazia callipaeda]|uniref:GLTP domain-containing protein n=1 Tax=Thelazia callipaeda TaxID=103827 RepID=A0A0N5CK78_THECL|nr:unnamed protein product [Thelazia callipaeda]
MQADITSGNRDFNIDVVTKFFEESLVNDNDVRLPSYINAFRELNKFIALLGKGFNFIEKDLLEKEKILNDLYVLDSSHYATVNSMISCESRSAQSSRKGSRTLLRLHRALLFITDFLKNLNQSREGDQISALCQSSYDNTLSKHHSWIIRQCVRVATRFLASRDILLKAVNDGKMFKNELEVQQAITKLVTAAEQVYGRVQQIYKNENILDLP